MTPTLHAAEKPFIISGFDDVLRQAENTGFLKSAIKILEKDRVFSGMPELYSTISKQESAPQFVIVSAIAIWFDQRIDNFLKESGFPVHRRYLRNWLTQWSIEDFKMQSIHEIVSQRPSRKFIVIFDNSDASLLLANQLRQQFSNQIEAIYLRKVIEKKLPAETIAFFTAFDIALHEHLSGRLGTSEVETVGNAILKEQEPTRLFPAYSICPRSYDPCKQVDASIFKICQKVQAHIQDLCQRRLY